MMYVSSRTRFARLQKVFSQGRSDFLNYLAQMSVLYEDLRIENFALTANDEEVKRLDYLDKKYRVHYFLRRSMLTLLEFRGALNQLSRTDEFKTEKAATFRRDTSEAKKANRDLFKIIAAALTFFESNHKLLKNLRNEVGGHFSFTAAAAATAHVEADTIGKLEITFDKLRRGGGPKLHYAGEIAAAAFTKTLPGIKSRQGDIEDAIKMMRDAYVHAANSMHALIIIFLWDRFV
jgi:hypothetical protein